MYLETCASCPNSSRIDSVLRCMAQHGKIPNTITSNAETEFLHCLSFFVNGMLWCVIGCHLFT